MPEAVVTLTQHFPASGEKNGRTWTRHDFKTADGTKFITFDGGTGQRAKDLLNKPVKIIYDSETRNGYTNHTLKDVEPAGFDAPVGNLDDSVHEKLNDLNAKAVARAEGPDWDEIGLRKTRCGIANHLGAALFNSLPSDEQTIDAAILIADRLVTFVYEGK